MALPALATIAPFIPSALGAIGALFGSKGGQSTGTTTNQLSPEQQQLQQILLQLAQQGIDPQILQQMLGSTRDRFGAEGSALRQSAQQRLQRGGVPQAEQESILSGINTPILREMGAALTNIEFQNERFKLQPLQMLQGLLGGTGTRTSQTQFRPPTGAGFAQFAASAFPMEHFSNLFKKGNQQPFTRSISQNSQLR